MMDYRINIDYSSYDIGKAYYREGKKCILDLVREMFVVEIPEEIIRQKFVRYLIEELKVPKKMIRVEVPMSHFIKGERGRADIVVFGENDDGVNVPVLIVECKAPNVTLIDEVWYQVYNYNSILDTELVVITNGENTYAAKWDEDDQNYFYLETIPKYEHIMRKENFKYIHDDSEGWKRPSFKELNYEKTINEFFDYGWIGEGTDDYLYPLIINLAGFLHDISVDLAPFEIEGFKIVEDGTRFTSNSNAAGGTWDGDYRYFILEDQNGNNQIVSISIFGSIKCNNDPVFGNRKGHTTLVVAIDDFDSKHNSLQLNLDKYTKKDGSEFTIWHDGTLTVGKIGSAKRQDVIDYIKSKDQSIVDGYGNIILGTFDCSKEIHWSQNSTKRFIKNIMKYSILRDEYRRIKKR